MWVYIKNRDGNNWLYTVGFFEPAGHSGMPTWHSDEDFNKVEDARARVNYLNGGSE